MDDVRGNKQHRADKYRRRLIGDASDHSRMCHRTNRALVAGELGILVVDMDGLGKAAEPNQQDAQQS